MTPDEAARRLDPKAFAALREDLMTKITLVALAASQKRTPVRTGTLRRSETTRVEPGGLVGAVGTNVVYAPMVHMRKPFFSQGLDDARPRIEQLAQEAGEAFFSEVAR